MRLTTGRRLDSYNTGVQTGRYVSPLRFGETVDLFAGRCRDVRNTGRRKNPARFAARLRDRAGAY